jgi:hypothetical protein
MSTFEAALLSDASKRAMCQELLEEFGAKIHRINDKNGEMVHGCLISPQLHRDQDRNPTASLNYRKLAYNCLGCGASGGLLWFIATCRGETSSDARRWLEETAGLGGQVMELEALLRFLDHVYERPAAVPVPTYSDRVLAPWSFIHPYFTEGRGIPQETVLKYRLGWDEATDRVVLPHFWRDQLVGWQTRKLPPEWRAVPWDPKPPRPDGEPVFDLHSGAPGSPKYHSSPDFPKDSTIFNYSPSSSTVVMEAMLSALKHEHAFHSEAVFGAKVPETQLKRLVKHDEVVLWMDNDTAGWRAVLGLPQEKPTKERPEGRERTPGMAELLAQYVPVRVVDSPFQQDPAELPTDVALDLRRGAVPWSLWEPPRVLRCFHCDRKAHEGPCRT